MGDTHPDEVTDRQVAAIFPDVPPPSGRVWRLVAERLDAAASEERGQPTSAFGGLGQRRNGRRERETRRPLWVGAGIVGAAAAAVLAWVFVPASTQPPASPPSTKAAAWRLVSSTIRTTYSPKDGILPPDAITCPTALTCYVVTDSDVVWPGLTDGAGPDHNEEPVPTGAEVTRDGGSSWQVLPIPSGTFITSRFTCPTATVCKVLAIPLATWRSGTPSATKVLSTANGGATWTSDAVSIPPDPGPDPSLVQGARNGGVAQLTCFTADTCVGFGTTPYGLAEGGSTGHTAVMQTVFLHTHDGGAHWSMVDLPWESTPTGGPAWSNAEHATFSCPTPQVCVGLATVWGPPSGNAQATFALAWRTDDGGGSWTHAWLPQQLGGTTVIGSMTCSDVTHCLGISGASRTSNAEVFLSSDGGSSWTAAPLPDTERVSESSVTCRSDADCWIAGATRVDGEESGAIFGTIDGGSTWELQAIPGDIGEVQAITCPSAACDAVGLLNTTTHRTELLTNG